MSDVGRPTKYKDEFNEQAYKLCLLRATDKELADFFGICEATLNNWKIEYPEFLESIRTGKEIADMGVVQSLYDGTMDRLVTEEVAIKVKEIKYNKEGRKVSEVERVEVIPLQKPVPGDFRNQQFWLKNRQGDKWRDKSEVESKVLLTNKMTDDQFEKALEDARNNKAASGQGE